MLYWFTQILQVRLQFHWWQLGIWIALVGYKEERCKMWWHLWAKWVNEWIIGHPICGSFGWMLRRGVVHCMHSAQFWPSALKFWIILTEPSRMLSPWQTVAERTAPTQRQSVQENSYVAHVHSRPASDGICGVLVSDSEYPGRVAFSLLQKTLDEFVMKCPRSNYDTKVNAITTGSAQPPAKGVGVLPPASFPQAQDYLTRYQDPRQADSIMRVQQELDETKIVLVSWGKISERMREWSLTFLPCFNSIKLLTLF